MNGYLFRLYVTGSTGNSMRAIRNLESLCERVIPGRYNLEIIDVLEHPELAEAEKILATPTLVKESPLPVRKIIGDLTDHDTVLLALDLSDGGVNTARHEERGT